MKKCKRNPIPLNQRIIMGNNESIKKLETLFQSHFDVLSTDGTYGITYKFKKLNNIFVNGIVLRKGTYVLKYFHNKGEYDIRQNKRVLAERRISFADKNQADKMFTYVRFEDCIKKLLTFSKLGVIPKVRIVTDEYIVMDYVDGKSLRELNQIIYGLSRKDSELLFNKLEKIIKFIHSLGLSHGDLTEGNILISRSENGVFDRIYLIDPSCRNDQEFDLEKLRELKKWVFRL